MVKYAFKTDEPLTIKSAAKANAQKIGEALAQIAEQNKGHLTPDATVETAQKNRQHVLRQHFEWDDKVAGHKYRLEQARSLIRSIHIETDDAESGVARAYYSIREKSGTSYRALHDVLTSADLQAKVLNSMERDLLAFEARYRSMTEICDLIRDVRSRISSKRSEMGQDSRAGA